MYQLSIYVWHLTSCFICMVLHPAVRNNIEIGSATSCREPLTPNDVLYIWVNPLVIYSYSIEIPWGHFCGFYWKQTSLCSCVEFDCSHITNEREISALRLHLPLVKMMMESVFRPAVTHISNSFPLTLSTRLFLMLPFIASASRCLTSLYDRFFQHLILSRARHRLSLSCVKSLHPPPAP